MCVRINSFHVVVVVPLQGRGKAMALENVAHRLVTHGVSEIGECPHDAVITPRGILLGHADNQGLESWGNFGTAWRLPLLGAIELLCTHTCRVCKVYLP